MIVNTDDEWDVRGTIRLTWIGNIAGTAATSGCQDRCRSPCRKAVRVRHGDDEWGGEGEGERERESAVLAVISARGDGKVVRRGVDQSEESSERRDAACPAESEWIALWRGGSRKREWTRGGQKAK